MKDRGLRLQHKALLAAEYRLLSVMFAYEWCECVSAQVCACFVRIFISMRMCVWGGVDACAMLVYLLFQAYRLAYLHPKVQTLTDTFHPAILPHTPSILPYTPATLPHTPPNML